MVRMFRAREDVAKPNKEWKYISGSKLGRFPFPFLYTLSIGPIFPPTAQLPPLLRIKLMYYLPL